MVQVKRVVRRLTAVVVVVCAVGACSVELTERGDPQPIPQGASDVTWDLSDPVSVEDLGARGVTLDVESSGADLLDVNVKLPDGASVTGEWSRAGVREEDSAVAEFSVGTGPTDDEKFWAGRVNEFADTYGVDPAEVFGYVADVEVNADGLTTHRYFEGDPQPGFVPTLLVNPLYDDGEAFTVSVTWLFAFEWPELTARRRAVPV